MPAPRQPKATAVRALAIVVLCIGANLALLQAAHAMNQPPEPGAASSGVRLHAFAPALLSLLITGGFFGTLLGLASIFEKPIAGSSATLESALVELNDSIHVLHRLANQRSETPPPPAPVELPFNADDVQRIVQLLEEIREISLLDDAGRKTRLEQHAARRRTAAVAQIDQHIRREEWSRADELISELERDFPDDASARDARRSLEAGRAAAEADALERARSSVEDLMAVSSWDQAHAAAEAFAQNFPHNKDGQALLQRVTHERDIFRDNAVQRLYEQIKRDIELRQWRKALAGAQRLIERFPDHYRTNKTRTLLRTIQDNAEIEERQEQEAHIQQLIKARRFDEAISLGEELIKRFPLSPQADAMEELLPKLRDRAKVSK